MMVVRLYTDVGGLCVIEAKPMHGDWDTYGGINFRAAVHSPNKQTNSEKVKYWEEH